MLGQHCAFTLEQIQTLNLAVKLPALGIGQLGSSLSEALLRYLHLLRILLGMILKAGHTQLLARLERFPLGLNVSGPKPQRRGGSNNSRYGS
jgi:hypothetical protein